MWVDCAVIQRKTPAAETRLHRRADGPVRTCVGCRKRELAVELLRVVAVSTGSGNHVVTVDAACKLPGRGAWLHPVPECLHQAVRRRAFTRALRIAGSPDISGVLEHIDRTSIASSPRATEQVAKNMSTP
ncbi:MAG TPA: YlxR family protein [Mycobacterium sp.]